MRNIMTPRRRTVATNSSPQASTYSCCHWSNVALKSASCSAVECGYWHLWHYNPMLEEQGKNPFVMDSKEPDWSKFRDFLMKEVRYTSLQKSFPAEAEELFAAAEENAKWRYNSYQRQAKMEY